MSAITTYTYTAARLFIIAFVNFYNKQVLLNRGLVTFTTQIID